MLDPALLRPGRFDRIILVDVPDEKGRKQILEVHTKNTPISVTKDEVRDLEKLYSNDKVLSSNLPSKMAVDEAITAKEVNKSKKEEYVKFKDLKNDEEKLLHHLAKITEGFVGADLEGLVREAVMTALRRDMGSKFVSKADFDEALNRVKSSVSSDSAKRYKKIEEYYLKSARSGIEAGGPIYTG